MRVKGDGSRSKSSTCDSDARTIPQNIQLHMPVEPVCTEGGRDLRRRTLQLDDQFTFKSLY